MSSKTNIVVIGATGYIGGSVLARILEHPNVKSFNITALVRSAEKASKLESLGVQTVVGSTDDTGEVETLASQADLLLSIASSDDVSAIKAILSGLKKRHAASGKKPTLIHTSGTGVLVDNAMGTYAPEVIYDDLNIAQIESLAPTQMHRNVDLEVVAADEQGYVNTYIILPGTIYGIATGKLVGLGIQNAHSVQIPLFMQFSLKVGFAGTVGSGKNVWPHISIDETTDLFLVLFNHILQGSTIGHGREGYYFGENGEYTGYQLAKAVGDALSGSGLLKTSEPVPFKEEHYKIEPMLVYYGKNSRCQGNRSRALGWKPVHTTEDMLASVSHEIDNVQQKKPRW